MMRQCMSCSLFIIELSCSYFLMFLGKYLSIRARQRRLLIFIDKKHYLSSNPLQNRNIHASLIIAIRQKEFCFQKKQSISGYIFPLESCNPLNFQSSITVDTKYTDLRQHQHLVGPVFKAKTQVLKIRMFHLASFLLTLSAVDYFSC